MSKLLLKDVIEEINDKTTENNQFIVLTSSQDGIVPQDEYFKRNVSSSDNTGYKIIKKGQFTYRSMSDTGYFYINLLTDYDIGIVSPAYPVFKIKNESLLLPQYLLLFFRTPYFMEQAKKNAKGSTRLSLKYKNIENIEIEVPTIEDQKRIISEINKIEKSINNRNNTLIDCELLIESKLHDILQQAETVDTLGKHLTIVRGASPRPINDYITDGDGVNWIKIGDANENDMYIRKTLQRITNAGANKSRRVKKGDLILSNSMSFGKPYILDIDGCVHDGWLILSNYENCFNKVFLCKYLGSKMVFEKFKKLAIGGVVNNLNSDMVRNLEVEIPRKEEQDKFAMDIERIEKMKQLILSDIIDLKTLMEAKMWEFFN